MILALSTATLWLVALPIAVAVTAGVLFLAAPGSRTDLRWARWPLAVGLVALAGTVAVTPPWPDGLGLEDCKTIANPALEANASADPSTIELCSDLGATSPPIVLLLLLALLVLAPDISEFAIPGLVTLKRKVEKQEEETGEQKERLERLAVRVDANASATANSAVAIYMKEAKSGIDSPSAASVAQIAAWVLERLKSDLSNRLGREDLTVAVYRPVPAEGVLRQIGVPDAHVTDFRPGFGATGQAFKFGETIVVSGESVNNGDYGLTEEQQEFWESATIVGSAPVPALDSLNAFIGVLTCSSSEPTPQTGADGATVDEDIWHEALDEYAKYVAAWMVAFTL